MAEGLGEALVGVSGVMDGLNGKGDTSDGDNRRRLSH